MKQRKTFSKQRIPECSGTKPKTADTDILVTFGNGGRKIMQTIKIKSKLSTTIRSFNQFSHFIWISSKDKHLFIPDLN